MPLKITSPFPRLKWHRPLKNVGLPKKLQAKELGRSYRIEGVEKADYCFRREYLCSHEPNQLSSISPIDKVVWFLPSNRPQSSQPDTSAFIAD